MKKNGKSVFVVLAVLVLTLAGTSLWAAGGAEGTSKGAVMAPTGDPMAKYDPVITVTTVKIIPDGMQYDPGDTLENNFWTRAYERDLGINIDYIWAVPAAQGTEKMNVSIAANDLPDLIPANLVQFAQLAKNGVALDITEYIANYATPFTKTILDSDYGVGINQVSVKNRVMALPLISGNIDAAPMIWIRTDWLDKLGLQPPKTMNDIETILRAFVDKDPDGNGVRDTLGLVATKDLWGGFPGLEGFFAAFHAYPNTWVDTKSGMVEEGSIQPEAKDALAKLADLYSKGLLDPEFVVKDGSKIAELTTAGRAGMVFGQHWIPFWPLQSTIDGIPGSDWKPFPLVSADSKPALAPIHGSAGTAYVVNVKMEHPEAAIKIYNYGAAKDCALSDDFDPEFHADDSRKYNRYQYQVASTFYGQQNIFIHRGVTAYLNGDETADDNYWVADNLTQIKSFLDGDTAIWMTYRWSGPEGAFSVIDGYDKNNLFYQDRFVKAPTSAMADNATTLSKMRDEVFTKIIIGDEPLSAFDEFVTNWRKLGGDLMIKEVNAEL